MEVKATEQIERELQTLKSDAENALFNIELFGFESYDPRQLHQWKEAFEEGLLTARGYSEFYRRQTNNNSITGIKTRRTIKSCIDYLTNEMISRYKSRSII